MNNTLSDNIKAIAFQNDAFRSEIGSFKSNFPAIKGKCILGKDVSNLPKEHVNEIIYRTRDFNGFDRYNDPNGEHNKGRFYYGPINKDVVWEIHYYADGICRKPSQDPSDVSKTYRDLRINLEPRL